MDRSEFFEKTKHLPPFLRDFHDQKGLFKALHAWFEPVANKDEIYKMPNWIAGQIYTIDYFLKFMALHGWTLQKCRSKVEFCDLDATIKAQKDRELASLQQFIFGTTPTKEDLAQ